MYELSLSAAAAGRPLEVLQGAGQPAMDGKDDIMWVFDGEEWTQDGGTTTSSAPKAEATRTFDELMPELQVIEIVPLPTKNQWIPPLPLP